MGCCLSSGSPDVRNIRVVHLNGQVEDFEYPIFVSQITGKPSKHFVSTTAHLLSNGSKSLNPDTQLQPGQIYFLLPYSTLQAEVSPLDFASIAKRLTSIAKKSTKLPNNNNISASSSPITSPSRFLKPAETGGMVAYRGKRSLGGGPWKPILDTIREKSFNRRSESEVMQEMQLEAQHDA